MDEHDQVRSDDLGKVSIYVDASHEFDEGEEYLGKFIKTLNFPVVSSNIEMADAPNIKAAGVKPYHIFEEYQLGVIGYISNTTQDLSGGSKNIKFYNPADVVQKYVKELHSKGIKRIVCVSHNGYFDDIYLAENTYGIDLIVGGHSHSLLLEDPTQDAEAVGKFPTPVLNRAGKTTYVVQGLISI